MRGLMVLGAMVIWSGCPEDSGCREPEAGAEVARIASPITLRKGVLRTREAVIGNLAADAVWNGFNGKPGFLESGEPALCEHIGTDPSKCIDVAMTNAGGLRFESACGERSEWREGVITERDINQLLPFGNDIVAIGVTGQQLYEAFEQSVALLGQPGRFSWGGGFLHSAGARVMIDCGGAARLTDEGGQVRSEQVGDRVVMICTRRHGSEVGQTPPWEVVERSEDPERIYRVGVNAFLAGGGDDFTMWVNQSADGTVVPQTLAEPASPGTDQELMTRYLGLLSNGGGEEFDPNARTRMPGPADGECVYSVAAGDPRFEALRDEPLCELEGNQMLCRLDPSSRLTFLRRSLCYP
ncbi:MAG: 5'-nucleotidase [Myxococcota bacterium]|nr:5'-nucleotidase [Myxococcota bacterium]